MSSGLPKELTTAPPPVPNVQLTFPAPHVLLITLDRPGQLNALPSILHAQLDQLYKWYDAEPHLRAAVLTGSGRAFCAGADLKEWDLRHSSADPSSAPSAPTLASGAAAARPFTSKQYRQQWTTAGFGGLSNRAGKKPVIAAVNGLCMGGGMEMVLNCDMVVASAAAKFGLPEVRIGVVAVAGALSRLIRTVGRQRAGEMALLGRTYSAEQMERWGVVNFVVAQGEDVVRAAVGVAEEMAANSPDSVLVSREGMRLGLEVGPELATEIVEQGLYGRIDGGENMKEGVRSFIEKRKPVWKDSKL